MNLWITIGSVSAFISVAAGAFGAHALTGRIEPRLLEVFKTAAHYQMNHSLAILACVFLIQNQKWILPIYLNPLLYFSIGILLFSGSLYALVLTRTPWLGAITPLGGLCFLGGWAMLGYHSIIGGGKIS